MSNSVASLHEQARDSHESALRAWAEIARLRKALEEIANADYRGNRSVESQIAWEALNRGR